MPSREQVERLRDEQAGLHTLFTGGVLMDDFLALAEDWLALSSRLERAEAALKANADEAEAILQGGVLVSACAIRIRDRALAAVVGDERQGYKPSYELHHAYKEHEKRIAGVHREKETNG